MDYIRVATRTLSGRNPDLAAGAVPARNTPIFSVLEKPTADLMLVMNIGCRPRLNENHYLNHLPKFELFGQNSLGLFSDAVGSSKITWLFLVK